MRTHRATRRVNGACTSETLGDTDIGADRLTVQPSGVSGWHEHPAPVHVTVTQGSIVWYDGSDPLCTAHTYKTGKSFIEGAYRVHNVANASRFGNGGNHRHRDQAGWVRGARLQARQGKAQ